MKIFIHPATESTIVAMSNSMPQSLLLMGQKGIGLSTLARQIAAKLTSDVYTVLPEKDEVVNLEKGAIGVSSIRKLYDYTKSTRTQKQVVIIDYTERMTLSAQNAFLKLLEEPPTNTHFILLSHDTTMLLPTILSRVWSLEVKPITAAQTEELLRTLNIQDAQKKTQILFMASGLPAEITRLAEDDAYFDTRVRIVRDARELLRGSLYNKLIIAQKYKDSREDALELLTDALAILRKTISDKPDAQLIAQVNSLLLAYEKIGANGSIRLCLARLVV